MYIHLKKQKKQSQYKKNFWGFTMLMTVKRVITVLLGTILGYFGTQKQNKTSENRPWPPLTPVGVDAALHNSIRFQLSFSVKFSQCAKIMEVPFQNK